MARGGKREGAGRKAKEPTVRVRVPESLVDEVQSLIAEQKEMILRQYPKGLNDIIEKLPDIQKRPTHMAYIALLLENWDCLKDLPRNYKRVVLKSLK